jgi:hypothetical protein
VAGSLGHHIHTKKRTEGRNCAMHASYVNQLLSRIIQYQLGRKRPSSRKAACILSLHGAMKDADSAGKYQLNPSAPLQFVGPQNVNTSQGITSSIGAYPCYFLTKLVAQSSKGKGISGSGMADLQMATRHAQIRIPHSVRFLQCTAHRQWPRCM